MKKSLYSLILSDDVVSEIDRMAYNAGTNRSNMINQILAERVSLVTPERRARVLFDHIAKTLPVDTFRVIDTRSDFFFSVRSALAYKYNPTLKYTFAALKSPASLVGELRVSVRSSSSALLSCFDTFFEYWQAAEIKGGGDIRWRAEPFKYSKELIYRNENDFRNGSPGDDIALYIAYLDKGVKTFFSVVPTCIPDDAETYVYAVYSEYAKASGIKFR